MLRTACFAVVLASSISAFAQEKAALPGQFQAPAPGSYSGTLKAATGSASSDVKLDVRNVTQDGRVTAHVSATNNANPACTKSLPASGIMLRDSSMRLEVDAGAPEGCERVYNVKASGGSLTGTFVESAKAKGKAGAMK